MELDLDCTVTPLRSWRRTSVKNVLILGGSGLVGRAFARKSLNTYRIIASSNSNTVGVSGVTEFKLSLRKDKSLPFAEMLDQFSPDVVVNSLLFLDPDACEINREAAYFGHVTCTKNLAAECRKRDVKLIYVSTDFVFDGKRSYSETDVPHPISYYGETKRLAEIEVTSVETNAVIRPSTIYGWRQEGGILNSLVSKLRARKTVYGFVDQYTKPTFADDLATCLNDIIDRGLSGIYHTVGPNCMTRYEFFLKIANTFGLNPELIQPMNTSDLPLTSNWPLKSCLEGSKAQKEFGLRFSAVEEGLLEVLEQSKKLVV